MPALSSCITFKGSSGVPEGRNLWDIGEQELNSSFIHFGRVIGREEFKRGGRLLVLPFKAGAGVLDDDGLDKISFMLVRGFVDIFEEDKDSVFDLIIADDSEEAEFVVEGYILEAKHPGRIYQKLRLGQRKLRVEGVVTHQQSGEIVVVFDDVIEGKEKDGELKAMGRTIGQNIARFLLNEVRVEK